MEVSEGVMKEIAGYLEATLSPEATQRKGAELFLESVEANKGYALVLLSLVDNVAVDVTLRVAAAITFKNFVKRKWRVADGGEGGGDPADKIHPDDRNQVKQRILELMLRSPEQIQRQLSEAISVIGRQDFPSRWESLLPEMVAKFHTGDFHQINGILQTANSLFKPYRHEFKSQKLWTEIKYVLGKFALPLTELFKNMMGLAEKHAQDAAALRVIFSSLNLIAKIFYSLNYQDLPEEFEDTMSVWMPNFHSLLTVDNKLLRTEDQEEAGLLETTRSQVCDIVSLYAWKYEEEFAEYLPQFVTAVWNLLLTTGQQVKYDMLVSNAIQFLSSVADRPQSASLFSAPDVLNSICEKVVLPNMEFRPSDEENFEDNPEEYIRRDIEGSDVDTRRRAACDLVRALARHFETSVISIFTQYVQLLLQQYQQNPKQNWKAKDTAIFLVTSLAAKAQTARHGITRTCELVDVRDFLQTHVLPELQVPEGAAAAASVDEHPILKADCIKYVAIFRQKFPAGMSASTFVPALLPHLTAKSQVQHSYAAHCVERLLTMRDMEGKPVVPGPALAPHAEKLLSGLFATFDLPGSAENEFAMKALVRLMATLQALVVPHVPLILGKLQPKLAQAAKNPSKPQFNHYLFESLALMTRLSCRENPATLDHFEQSLFPVFEEILRADVIEFIPYTFQVMAVLLELRTTGDLPEAYSAIFPMLLAPVLWERPGFVPGLARLIRAFLVRSGPAIGSGDRLSPLLGVFQKLLASKATDHEAFLVMRAMVHFVPPDNLSPYMKQVFVLMFQRLHSSRTSKLVKNLIVFVCGYAVRHGGAALVALVDTVQARMFPMLARKVLAPDLQKISGAVDKKIVSFGLTNIIKDVYGTPYQEVFTELLQALIGLFELPEEPDDDDNVENIAPQAGGPQPGGMGFAAAAEPDSLGYDPSFSQLVYAGRGWSDPLQGSTLDKGRLHLATALRDLSVAHPGGEVARLISTGLQPQAAAYLQKYLASANITLV